MKKSFVLIGFILFLSMYSCGDGGDDNTIEAQGTIEATNIKVSSKVSGEVEAILKDEGELVSAGDTIIIIDKEVYELRFAEASAMMESAKATYELMLKGAREEDVIQANEVLKQAQINLASAKRDFERMQNLYDSKTITQKQFEDVKARYEVSQTQLQVAEQNFKKISNLARPEELKQAEANLNRAIANMNLTKKSLNDCYVTTPINGFIVNNFIEEGETVMQMSSLFQVADLSEIEMTIYVSETDLGKIKLNQSADISTDTYPDKNYSGRVSFISSQAEFTPKNIQTKEERTKLVFAVKIKIDNTDFELKDGMPADAVINL